MAGDRQIATPSAQNPVRATRWLRRGGIGAVLLGLMLGGLWLARLPLASALLSPLGAHLAGITLDAQVTALGPTQAQLARLSIGPDARLTVRRITLDYSLGDLLTGRLAGLSVDGLSARVDYDADGRITVAGLPDDWFAKQPPQAPSDKPPPTLPARIAITDLSLRATSPAGASTLTGDIVLDMPQAGDMPRAGGLIPRQAVFDLATQDGSARVDLTLSATDEHIQVMGSAEIDLARWAGFLAGVAGGTGRIAAKVDMRGAGMGVGDGQTPHALLALLDGTARLSPSGVTISLTDGSAISLADRAIDIAVAKGSGTLTLPQGFQASLPAPPAGVRALTSTTLPAMATAPITLSLAPGSAVALIPNGPGWQLASTAPMRLKAGPMAASLQPRMHLDKAGRLREITLAQGAQLRLAPSDLANGLSLRRPASLVAVAPVQIVIPPITPATPTITPATPTITGAIAVDDLALTLPDGTLADFYLPRITGDWQDGRGHVSIRQAAAHLPDQDITATLVTGDLTSVAGGAFAFDFRLPEIVRHGARLLGGQTRFAGDLKPDGADGWTLEAVLGNVDGKIETALQVTLPAQGAASLRFDTGTIRYQPDGLQPGAMSSLIDGLFEDVSGTLRLSGDIVQKEAAPDGVVTITLDALTFGSGIAKIRDLSGTIAFDAARLPATRATQTLTSKIAVAGIPAARMTLRFAIDEAARLSIERLAIEAFGGALSLENALYDPLANQFQGALRLTHIDLADAFASLRVEGLDGSGIIDGEIPLTLRQGPDGASALTVSAGQLAARDKGLLAIDHPALERYLSGQHQAVDLMVQALSDFRYENLQASLDIQPNGQGALALKVLGHNPAVLGGQVFDLNVTIETDFGKLFKTLEEALGVTDTLLERMARQVR